MKKTVLMAAEMLAGLGLDGYEVFAVQSEGLSLEAKEGGIEAMTQSQESGLAVLVLTGQRAGSAYTYDLSPAGLKETVEQARSLAGSATPEPDLSLGPQPDRLPETATVDENLAAVESQAKKDLALEMEAAALAYDRRVVKVRQAGYGEERTRVWLLNSLGQDLFREQTLCQASISLLAREGEESQMGYDFSFSPFYSELDSKAAAERAAARAVGLLGAKRAKTGPFSAVFDNMTASEIMSVLAPAFLAENVQKGKSLLAGKLGQKIFSGQVRIVDDGLYPKGVGTRPFDDEGSPQQRTGLVEEGVLAGYLYDRLSASKEGRDSTGNGSRPSLKAPSSPAANNLYLEPGEGNLEKLLEGIEEGFLITDLMGLHTADPISGDFSVGANGFWVIGGERIWPVQGAAVSGNLIDLFKRVDRVGDDLRFLGSVGAPSMALNRLDVAG